VTCRFSRIVRQVVQGSFGKGRIASLKPMSPRDERDLAELHRRREQRRRDRELRP
jgi:hypothetical protein